jgi:hypothetical protein
MKHICNFFVVLFDVIVETRAMQAKRRYKLNEWS